MPARRLVRRARAAARAVGLLVCVLGVPADAARAAQERVPVILVPGWRDRGSALGPLRRHFLARGWEAGAVVAVDFADPYGSNVDHAAELAAVVDRLLEATGVRRVDIVAHSMGGLAVRYYLGFRGGAATVRRVVFLGTPHRGTYVAYVAWGAGADEMEPGSELLEKLNGGPPMPGGVEAITVRTRLDLRILPGESATLPGATNLEVCCPTHRGLLRDEETFELILGALSRP